MKHNILSATFGALALLALLLMTGKVEPTVEAAGRADYTHARHASYMIVTEFENSDVVVPGVPARASQGTAVAFAPQMLVTAAHLFEDGIVKNIQLHQGGEVTRGGKVLYVNHETDIAIIWAPVDCPCVQIADRPTFVDEPVFHIGYPDQGLQMLWKGTASELHDYNGFIHLATTVLIKGGQSGGGLFGTVRGELRLFGIAQAYPTAYLYAPFPEPVYAMGLFSPYATLIDAVDCVTPGRDEKCHQPGETNAEG